MLRLKKILLIIGGALLAGGAIALRLIGIGERKQKADTLEAQRKVERETQEAADHAKRENQRATDQARAARDRGDFRHFDDD